MSRKIITLLFILFATRAFSQEKIKGKVIDETTLLPLQYATVNEDKKGPGTITDQQGDFELRTNSNTDSLDISFVGYNSRTIALKNAPDSLIIRLSQGTVDLKAVTIQPMPNEATFSTMSKIDVNLHAMNSSQDLMRLVPGLSLMKHQGGGVADHIFFRGFDADHGTDVAVYVDGMPLNLVSQIHGQGYADLHFLIPELVTSLQYGKGPYYADRGDFNSAAYLSFKTADVLDKSEVKLEGGQFGYGRVMTAINLLSDKAKQRGTSAYIAAEGRYTNGPFKYPEHFNRGNIFGKFITKLSPKTQLKITLSEFSSNWRSSGEVPLRAVKEGIISRWGYIDSAQGGNTSRTTAITRLTSSLSDRLTLQNQFYYAHYFFNLHFDQTFFKDDPINGDQLKQRELRDLYGYNGKLTHHNYFKNNGVLTSSAGLGFQMNNIYGSQLSHTKNFNHVLEYLEHGDITEWTLNGYLDEQYRIGKWMFDAGVRLDYLNFYYKDFLNPVQPSIGKTIVSPKLNAEYTFNNRLQIYGKIGKGFHSNDAKVVAENKGLKVLPSAYGADLRINWKPVPQLYLNAALWYLYLQQEFVYDGDEGTFEPGDPTRRQGFDLSARYEFTRWLYANYDLNISRARDVTASKGNNLLPLAVPFYSSAGLYLKLPSGWNGGWTARYMGDRPATSNNSLVAKGYFLNDITANYTQRKYEIGLEIQNLFNTKWRDAQYEIESRLKYEPAPVDDISFTPGMPFFAKLKFTLFIE